MSFNRYVPRINELTEKLKTQGDITENEADFIYQIYRLVCIDMENESYGFTGGLDESRLFPVFEALSEWYRAVLCALNAGLYGNFVSTVSTNPVLSIKEISPEIIKILDKREKTIIFTKNLPDTSNMLLGDTVTEETLRGSALFFSRYGIKERMSRKKGRCELGKESSIIKKLAEKIKTSDLTVEEADFVFSFLQTVQYLDRKRKLEPEVCRSCIEIVNMWFQCVLDSLYSGRKGNFVTTIPLVQIMPETDELHNKCLFMLNSFDRAYSFASTHKEADFIGVDRVNFVLFSAPCFSSQRAGIVPLLADINTYKLFKTASEYKADFLVYTTDSIVIIEEAGEHTVLIPKDRTKIAEYVLSLDDREIEEKAENSGAGEFILEAVMRAEKNDISEEDDSWVEIER